MARKIPAKNPDIDKLQQGTILSKLYLDLEDNSQKAVNATDGDGQPINAEALLEWSQLGKMEAYRNVMMSNSAYAMAKAIWDAIQSALEGGHYFSGYYFNGSFYHTYNPASGEENPQYTEPYSPLEGKLYVDVRGGIYIWNKEQNTYIPLSGSKSESGSGSGGSVAQTIYELVIQKNGAPVGQPYNPAKKAQVINIDNVANASDLIALIVKLSNAGNHSLPIYFGANAVPSVIDSLQVPGNIESTQGGVSAKGIADLSISGGGGSGTLTKIQINGVEIPDSGGVVNITAVSGSYPGEISIAGQRVSVYGLGSAAFASTTNFANAIHTHNFSDLNNIPTTLGGYGITDAKIANGVITLGSNTITPLTAHQAIYALTVKNSDGGTEVTYDPKASASTLTLTKAMVGLGSVKNQAITVTSTSVSDGTTTFDKYVHPTSAGNKHIPSGGASGKLLGYGGSSGTASWVDKPSYDFSEIGNTPTTLSEYGITDGFNDVTIDGNGNAITTASFNGHNLILTKGSSFKTVQSVVNDPSAAGSAIDFIATISQNANGVISATKKTVRDASQNQSGVVNTTTQTFAGAKTFNSTVTVVSDITSTHGNIQALAGGVAAYGIADLAISGGGEGAGTLTQIQVNGSVIPDTNGVVNIPLATTAEGGNGAMSYLDKTKLNEIEEYAQVNVLESVKVNGTPLTITNKAVNIPVPTALSQLTDDATHRLVTDTQITTWTGKQDAISDLFTIRTQAGEGHTVYGYFNSGILPISAGGTGASTAAGARTNLGLGAAATYGVGSVAASNTGLVTGGDVYSAINSALTAAMKIEGETTTQISDGSTTNPVVIGGQSVSAYKGMVVFYGSKEFVWVGTSWKELGDESSFAIKTTTITGTGYLSGGGDLSASRTIDIAQTIKDKIDTSYANNHIHSNKSILDGIAGTAGTTYNLDTITSNISTLQGYFTGSVANSAAALTTNAGSTSTPVYFANGVPVACGFSVLTDVPSGAVFTDTKNTAGTTNNASKKLYLVGALSQAANPQTYSNVNVYIGTDNHLYSNGVQVVNLSASQALINKTYNGLTLTAASTGFTISGGTTSKTLTVTKTVTLGDAAGYGVMDRQTATAINNSGTSLMTERAVYYGLPTINGAHNYTSNTNIFAPTTAGTAGYTLVSAGSGAPGWTDVLSIDTANRKVNVGTAANPADLQSFGGVAARGIVDLNTFGGGGGSGTLTQIQINGTVIQDVNGVVNLPLATTSAAGAMSASDKSKLNGIEAGANNYSLPIASASVLGGVKVGSRLSIDENGVLSATYTYSLPLAANGTRGGVQIGFSESNSGSATNRNYAVKLSSEKMYVNVPWENTHNSHALTVTNGTASAVSQGTEITYVESVTGCNATSGNLTASTTRKKITVPSVSNATITIKQTGISDQTFTLNGSATTINLVDTTYESKAAASGGTAVSLVTTGEKYTWNNKQNAISDLATIRSNASNGNTAYEYFSNGVLPASKGGTGKTSLSEAGSAIINALGVGSSPATREDYIVAQYAGGGTTTTSYYRRKLSNIFAALNSGDITTALGYTPYNATNPNGYISGNQTITLSGDVSGSGATSIAVTIGAGKVTNAMLAGSIAISKISGLQTALDGKLATSLKGAANGLAELDANGLVPSSQLPSYVDDVLEYASKSAFPATGTSGKIYVALDTNLTYRWSGSAYTEISPSLALGETSSTAYRGDRGKTAYTHATDANRLTTAQTSGFYKFATTSEGHIKSVTAVTASDLTTLIGSTTYAPYNANGYLPLTGGTLTGTGDILTLNNASGGDCALLLKRNTNTAWEIKVSGGNFYLKENSSGTNFLVIKEVSQGSLASFAGGLSATYLQSTVATGTAPLVVASTTAVTNLNADLLDGQHGSYYAVKKASVGSATNPIYTDANGAFQACTYSLNKTVPSDAVFTDTKNTAGGDDTSSKIFLVGMTAQTTSNGNSRTYTQDTAYVGTDGHLYSNSVQVVNLSGSQALTNKTYNGLTLTKQTTGFTIAGGTTSKTLTVNKDVTLGDAAGYAVCDSASASAISTNAKLVTERDVYYGLPNINGSHTYNSGNSIFAPTTTGTAGYALISAGSGAPVWTDVLSVDTVNRNVNVGTAANPANINALGGVAARGIVDLSTTGSAVAGYVTQINIGGTAYTPSSGIVSIPSSYPASDVYAWAKESTRPAYNTSIAASSGTAAVTLNFGSKYQLSAGDTNCIFALASLPVATTSAAGIAQLSSAVDSTSETLAATPKAVKTAYNLAAGKALKYLSTTVALDGQSSYTMSQADDSTYTLITYSSSSTITAVTLTQGASSIPVASCSRIHYICFKNEKSSAITLTLVKRNNNNYHVIAPSKTITIPANGVLELSYVHIQVSAARYTIVTVGDVMAEIS